MLTAQQIEEVNTSLHEGVTPEEIAKSLGMSRSALIFQLLQSGKRIATVRRLEATGSISSPMTQEREKAAA